MSFNQLLAIIEAIFTVHEEDMDCEGCDAEMPHLVELINAGQDPKLLLPAVQHHLERCHDCQEEFEALLAIVKAENEGLVSSEREKSG